MNWFWHAIFIALVIIPITLLWLGCLFDIFRRDDLRPAAQVLWLLAVLVVPVFGALTYLLLRPRHSAGAFAEEAPGLSSLSQQLSDLDRLHGAGALDDREFELAKADALAQVPAARQPSAGFSAGAVAAQTSVAGR